SRAGGGAGAATRASPACATGGGGPGAHGGCRYGLPRPRAPSRLARTSGGGERRHGRELPVRRHRRRRLRRRTPAWPGVTPVDPHGRKPRPFGRNVVVEQALRHVKELALPDAQTGGLAAEGVELPLRRLVPPPLL